MNKGVDERILPKGEYIDALNISVNSTNGGQNGPAKNIKGNTLLTPSIKYQGSDITNGRCIGAFADDVNETIYWFITADEGDLIVSYDTKSDILRYHVEGDLSFDKQYLITAVDKIDDLLFFTDNLNPPKRIDVTKSYINPSMEELLVIVKPPNSAPTVELATVPNQENYLEDRFVSFAYRWKYEGNEYSSLSPFSDVAFQPDTFNFDPGKAENGGMRNQYNSCNVTFNTGSSLVKGVDLCFKLADGSIIYVIQEFDKTSGVIQDNANHTLSFSNGKIYTTLDESEILRRYDNVPHKAQSLIFMGNRLMFANYEDGDDMVTAEGISGEPIDVQFSTNLISQDINLEELETNVAAGDNYTIDGNTVTIHDSTFTIDLSSTTLKKGANIGIDINTQHRQFTGTTGGNPSANGNVILNFNFKLPRDFANASSLVASSEFKAAIGFPNGAAVSTCGATDGTAGTSLTDRFVCGLVIPSDTNVTWTKNSYGISTSATEGVKITESGGIISFQLPAVKYFNNPNSLYEYFGISSVSATYQLISDTRSLHSNRDYEVAIEYMDEYNRSSTAIVSPNNTVFVPASASILKNSIRVILDSRPPYWATKYRFLLKRVQGTYETIYSNIFYRDVGSNSVFYKLDGQNQTKVKVGDDLIVKADVSGPLNTLVKTQVLSIESKPLDFILPDDDTVGEVDELTGLYMELKPSGFGSVNPNDSYPFIDNGSLVAENSVIPYPCHIESLPISESFGLAYDLPSGTVVRLDIQVSNAINTYNFKLQFTAGTDYNNLHSFVIGEGINFTEGVFDKGSGGIQNTFYSALATSATPGSGGNLLIKELGINKYQFFTDGVSGRLFLGITNGGEIPLTNATTRVEIAVSRATSLMVFETVPKDANVDLFYEGSQVYNITNGLHQSGGATGEQNQGASVPAVIDLNFFDCFTFGNGVESYKANDALDGRSFGLGQRVSSVSQQEFKRTKRFADITYSGVFQGPANINKTNQFNLGLANFKTLEQQYGPIGVMYPRETDILVIQEDKISYVLTDKNLLSDSVGGGSVASVPEVLGTQMARVEQYGTLNPESFSAFGSLKSFTDKKRGVVIELSGTGTPEQMDIVSSRGLRSFFRDFFTTEFDQQQLGGYDPYNDHYVLSSNPQINPTEENIIDCGTEISLSSVTEPYSTFIDFGKSVGDMTISYDVSGDVDFTVEWNGITTNLFDSLIGSLLRRSNVFENENNTRGILSSLESCLVSSGTNNTGTFLFNKSLPYPTKAKLTITPVGTATYTVKPTCFSATPLNVYNVTLYSTADENKTIINEWFWDVSGNNPSYVKNDEITLTNTGGYCSSV